MKYGVIDIGSNSVRLMLSDGRRALYKKNRVTRLAEGVGCGGLIGKAAAERTLKAIADFAEEARGDGADEVFAFATAAVRLAANGGEFAAAARKIGVDVEVVSGEKEAALGLAGALRGSDGGVIDVGGASTEITVRRDGKVVYAHSLALGAVRIFDMCGQDERKILALIDGALGEYGEVPRGKFYAIGGTATSLAAIDLALDPYDPDKVHGHAMTAARVGEIAEALIRAPVEARRGIKGLQPERAEVIAGGALLLSEIMKRFSLSDITVSESDNLEGYLYEKLGRGLL